MRKTIICIFLIISILPALIAQEDNSLKSVNEQYENFSWTPVAKARQYELVIEKNDPTTKLWTDYKIIKTQETSLEILFSPGIYRLALASYNLIGRRSKQSDWIEFQILEESVPRLLERFFSKSREWNIPVLYVSKNGGPLPDTPDSKNYIQAPQGYSDNTLLVKGRNIFSPNTEFYLTPIDSVPEGAKEYINICSDRKEQRLKVIQRNSKECSVVVSYDKEALSSGYYNLEVRNPGEDPSCVELLVLDDSLSRLQPQQGFEADPHYNVNSFTLSGSDQYEFSVLASGVNSLTEFYMEPVSGAASYPFESSLPRKTVALTLIESSKQENDYARLDFSCSTEELKSGYYNFTAKNWDGTLAKFICLVKRPFDHDYTGDVKKIKTKFNKKTEFVDVTINDKRFDISKTYTLVSQYDENIKANYRVPLQLSPAGKKLTGVLLPDQLTIAKYALLIEDEYSSDVIYCDIDNRLILSPQKMTASQIEKTFFRPEGGEELTLDTDDSGSITFEDNKMEMIKRMPAFFNGFKVDLSIKSDGIIMLGSELDLFNIGFLGLSAGYRYTSNSGEDLHGLYSSLRFAIPNQYVQPYLGIGVGQNLIFPEEGIKNFDSVKQMLLNKEEASLFAQAGILLFTVIDIRYNLVLNSVFTDPYYSEFLSVGFAFPLRSYKFKRNVLTHKAIINKTGVLNGPDFIEAVSDVDRLELLDSYSVGGFADYKGIEEITIGPSVAIIQSNAFRDCKKLTEVYITEKITEEVPLTIKSGAFAGNTQISSMLLPARTRTVEEGAFEGWTNGQVIRLNWNEDDSTERDLRGLENCSATILYYNDQVYKGNYKTPLDDSLNWMSATGFDVDNVSILKDDLYVLGISVNGFGYSGVRSELDEWINQTSPAEVLDYLKSGDGLSFMVQGDGNKYDLVITTEEGGYFYYRFKSKENMLTQVEALYDKFKAFGFSSQKKLDINKIKMICILPMCKGEWDDISLFDFEVYKK